jgi:G6PDH family F420-dependent oxidoreductase
MANIGYTLSSEEFGPKELVQNAQRAEELGFSFLMISDHFHPWVDEQGHSPFVWSVLGGVAQATQRIPIATGVTCPMIRIHPAILAQAAATTAAMMPGRFSFGIGTGENLNEHILGDRWPPYQVRLEMFEESLEIIRLLWEGGEQSYWGAYYTVENARIYTLPEELPPILISGIGSTSVEVAGELGDGLVSTVAKADIVKKFEEAGGKGKPSYCQITVCWAEDEAEARRTAFRIWPNAGVTGTLSQDLPTPAHFEQAAKMIREEDVAESIVCGPDPERHREKIQQALDAGYSHVYVHQVGPDQEGFFRFYQREILPKFR